MIKENGNRLHQEKVLVGRQRTTSSVVIDLNQESRVKKIESTARVSSSSE